MTTSSTSSRCAARRKRGRDYVNDYLFLVKLENGKIQRFQEYWDSKQAFELIFGE